VNWPFKNQFAKIPKFKKTQTQYLLYLKMYSDDEYQCSSLPFRRDFAVDLHIDIKMDICYFIPFVTSAYCLPYLSKVFEILLLLLQKRILMSRVLSFCHSPYAVVVI